MRFSSYPTATNIDRLRQLPGETVAFLPGWELIRTAQDTYVLSDSNTMIPLYGVGGRLNHLFLNGPGHLVGIDLHVRVRNEESDSYSYSRPVFELWYYEPSVGECNCGARHTFLPQHHSLWCESLKWR